MRERRARRPWWPEVFLPALLLLGGCGEGGGGGAAHALVADSAGVAVVTNTGAGWSGSRAWMVDSEPALSIGVVEGPMAYQFDQVVAAVRAPDGAVVVADAGAREIRWFSAEGRHLRTFGRDGRGPGEFDWLSALVPAPSGGLIAWDGGNQRITELSPAGVISAERTLPVAELDFLPAVEGLFGDGSLLIASGESSLFRVGARTERPPRAYYRLPRDAAGPLPLFQLPWYESFTWGSRTTAYRARVPFGSTSHVAVRGDRVWAADGARYEIRIHRMDGSLERVIRHVQEPLPVRADEVATARADLIARHLGMLGSEDAKRFGAEMPFPETHPALYDLYVDRGEHLWVRETPPGPNPSRWTVFDPEGRMLGPVELPAGLDVLEIGDDYVLGRWKDELDVEYVRLHRLRRSAR